MTSSKRTKDRELCLIVNDVDDLEMKREVYKCKEPAVIRYRLCRYFVL